MFSETNGFVPKQEQEKTKVIDEQKALIAIRESLSDSEQVVTAEHAEQLLKRFQPEIIQGLVRNYYAQIKRMLFSDPVTPSHGDLFLVSRNTSKDRDVRRVSFKWYFSDREVGEFGASGQMTRPFVEMIFSTPRSRIEKDTQEIWMNPSVAFSGYDVMNLESTKFSRGKRDEDRSDEKEGEQMVDRKCFEQFIESALKQPETFSESLEALNELWAKYKFPISDLLKLQQAIREFGTHEFRHRDGYQMRGLCLVTPRDFESFVMRRTGIRLTHAELTGATARRASYSHEERAELDAERVGSVVHEASVYKKTIVIDWTSRQFNNTLPLPEIIDLPADAKLAKQIEFQS